MALIRKVLFFKRFITGIIDYFDLYEPVTDMTKGDLLEIIDDIKNNKTNENPDEKQRIIVKNARLKKFKKKVKITFYVLFGVITLFGAFGPGFELYKEYRENLETKEAISNLNRVAKTMYFRENAPDVALKIIDKSLAIDDQNADTLYLKSFIESMLTVEVIKNLDRPYNKEELLKAQTAMANAEFLLESNNVEFYSNAYLIKAQTYFALEDNKRALEEIEKAISFDKQDNLFYRIRKASILVESKKYYEALKLLNDLDENYSDQRDKKHIYLWQGITYFQLHYSSIDEDKAKYYNLMKEKFEKALHLDDKFHLAMINLGRTLAKSDDGNKENNRTDRIKAVELYKNVLKIRPGNKKAYFLLGKLYGDIDKYEKAELYFKKALEIDDSYYSANLFLGMIYYELEDYDLAVEYYNKALLLNPQDVDAYYLRANTFKKLKKYKEAIKDYLEVIDETKDSYFLYMSYISRAEISLEKNMIKQAKQFLDEAKNFETELDETFYIAKFKYHKLSNEFIMAIESIDKAIKYSNKLKNSLIYDKAYYLFENNKIDMALNTIQEIKSIEKIGLHEKILKLEYKIYSKLSNQTKKDITLMEIRKYDPNFK